MPVTLSEAQNNAIRSCKNSIRGLHKQRLKQYRCSLYQKQAINPHSLFYTDDCRIASEMAAGFPSRLPFSFNHSSLFESLNELATGCIDCWFNVVLHHDGLSGVDPFSVEIAGPIALGPGIRRVAGKVSGGCLDENQT